MNLINQLIGYIPSSKPYDRPLRLRWCALGTGTGLFTVAVGELLAHSPFFVDSMYSESFSARLATLLGTLSGHLPFSLFEVLLSSFFLWLGIPALVGIFHVVRGQRHLANGLVSWSSRTIGWTGMLIAVFYVLWGFNYARPDLPTRVGWDDSELASIPRLGTTDDYEELVRLSTQLVFVTNYYYRESTGTRDLGEHSEPRNSYEEMDKSIDIGYERACRLLGLNESFAKSRGPAKPIYASRVLSQLGIAGFYAPWTGEANYNYEIPPCQLPMTIAHEKAHQRCVTSEDEANFLGFLACILSDDPYARYSGYLFAQRQLALELIRIDKPRAQTILALRNKGVQRDVYYTRAYNSVFRGAMQSLSLTVNNAYLRANRVQGGLLSYQLSARLFVLFARHNDDTCVVIPE